MPEGILPPLLWSGDLTHAWFEALHTTTRSQCSLVSGCCSRSWWLSRSLWLTRGWNLHQRSDPQCVSYLIDFPEVLMWKSNPVTTVSLLVCKTKSAVCREPRGEEQVCALSLARLKAAKQQPMSSNFTAETNQEAAHVLLRRLLRIPTITALHAGCKWKMHPKSIKSLNGHR